MVNQWYVNNDNVVANKATGEIVEIGINGQIYDLVLEGNDAGFAMLITNTTLANSLIKSGKTQYDPSTKLKSGEELLL